MTGHLEGLFLYTMAKVRQITRPAVAVLRIFQGGDLPRPDVSGDFCVRGLSVTKYRAEEEQAL